MTTPMLARIQHPRTPRTAQPHRTPAQVRRSNRRVERDELRRLVDRYVSVTR